MVKLRKTKHLHFVGIGGIGMSGIAEVLANLGYTVSGSDLASNETTKRLVDIGCRVHKGHDAANIEGADVIVISSAVAAPPSARMSSSMMRTGLASPLRSLRE